MLISKAKRQAREKGRRQYVRLIELVFGLSLPVYVVGSILQEPFMFEGGLAGMFFGLTLLGNIIFQTAWVEAG
jgi:hypothetical protein